VNCIATSKKFTLTFATIKLIESSTDNALENFGNIQFVMPNAFLKTLEKLRIKEKEEKPFGFSKSKALRRVFLLQLVLILLLQLLNLRADNDRAIRIAIADAVVIILVIIFGFVESRKGHNFSHILSLPQA